MLYIGDEGRPGLAETENIQKQTDYLFLLNYICVNKVGCVFLFVCENAKRLGDTAYNSEGENTFVYVLLENYANA